MISERLYEVALAAVVAVILLAFGIAQLTEFSHESRILALKSDLRKIRTAVALHYSRTNRYPSSVEQAAKEGLGRRITMLLSNIDENGRIRDPFGRRYSYNPATGEVRSRTSGCDKY